MPVSAMSAMSPVQKCQPSAWLLQSLYAWVILPLLAFPVRHPLPPYVDSLLFRFL